MNRFSLPWLDRLLLGISYALLVAVMAVGTFYAQRQFEESHIERCYSLAIQALVLDDVETTGSPERAELIKTIVDDITLICNDVDLSQIKP